MTPLSLLLIEDSAMDAELVLAELHRSGFQISSQRVDTETELRTALATSSFEIVLCDHEAAWVQLEGCAQDRCARAAPTLPFVILSGTIGEEAAVEVLKAGARDVVLKTNLARLGPVIDRELREVENHRHRADLERERRDLNAQLIRVNEELRASEEHNRLLFAQNPQPMLVYDRDSLAIVTVNDEFVLTYGYSREELLSMTIMDLAPPEEAGALLASLAANRYGARPDPANESASLPAATPPLQGRHDHRRRNRKRESSLWHA